jgi:hypothetical protein
MKIPRRPAGGKILGRVLTDIFREVEEDIRNAQLKALWDRYGLLVIGAAVALVVGTGIWVYWQDARSVRREAAAEQFLAGERLLLEGKQAEAAAHFARLSQTSEVEGYALLARMKEAATRVEQGDVQGAAAQYDALAADNALDPLLRAVAALKAALLLYDTASSDELTLRLSPLAAADAPMRHSARELLAFLALRQGDVETARQAFETLADDLDAPKGIRARAAETLQSLGPRPDAEPPAAASTEAPAAPAMATGEAKKK